jgi:hypothetical protein
MAQTQAVTARWITGCFKTSPTGGTESLARLLPIHFLLKRLAGRSATRKFLLADSHPLRPILDEAVHSAVLGPSINGISACADLNRRDVEPYSPVSQPGNTVLDLFLGRISQHSPSSLKKEDLESHIKELDTVWRNSLTDGHTIVIGSDASVPIGDRYQSTVAAVLYRLGNQVDVVRSAAGRSTAPEAERFAQQVGISRACAQGCSSIILVSDFFFFFGSTICIAGLVHSPLNCFTNRVATCIYA